LLKVQPREKKGSAGEPVGSANRQNRQTRRAGVGFTPAPVSVVVDFPVRPHRFELDL